MPCIALTFEVAAPDVDALGDALIEGGALAVDVSDAHAGTDAEQPLFGEPGSQPHPWPVSRVRALFAPGSDVMSAAAGACARAGVPFPEARVEAVDDVDWVRATQASITPQRITPALWIVPSWHRPPDPDALNIVIDPGLAFGTGDHPTTRMCLQWLAATVAPGASVIDYGCGSGILAIAAMKLGAAHATGIDVDPQALLAARDNAIQNRVEVALHAAAAPHVQPADILVANILAAPLRVLAPLLAALVRPGGRLALAGLLHTQADELIGIYRPWLDLAIAAQEQDWVLLAGQRSTPP